MLFIRHLNECNECVDYNSQWLMLLFVNIDNKYSVSLSLTAEGSFCLEGLLWTCLALIYRDIPAIMPRSPLNEAPLSGSMPDMPLYSILTRARPRHGYMLFRRLNSPPTHKNVHNFTAGS